MNGLTDEPAPTAAERWSAAIDAWASPPDRLTRAAFDDAVAARPDPVDDDSARDSLSARWAREVLPPTGGTVLDVGCGAGGAALALAPPASELLGVDRVGALLDEFVAATTRAGIARRTFHGTWPEVAVITPVADVVVCRGLVHDIADIAPFVTAMTMRARLAVVVELPVRHPLSAWNEGWSHFWGIDRPSGPVLADFLAVLDELGLDPEHGTETRPTGSAFDERQVAVARRRLALPVEREAELAAWLVGHPPAFVAEVSTVRWAGEADAGEHQAIA